MAFTTRLQTVPVDGWLAEHPQAVADLDSHPRRCRFSSAPLSRVRELGAEAIGDCTSPEVEAVVADVVRVGCEECVTVDPHMSREFGANRACPFVQDCG